MKVLLLLITLASVASALRFSHFPITVDTEVLLVNRPARLKCNYVKFRTESVREITWYAGYEGIRSKIFHYHVTTGKKEDSTYSYVRTSAATATENELEITLPEARGSPMTIGCEVQVLRDNGYGKLRTSKKLGEVNVTVVDTQGHQMLLKSGSLHGNPAENAYGDRTATVGQPLTVTCISRGTTPAPNLTLSINRRDWQDVSPTARITEPLGATPGTKVVEGYISTVYDDLFNSEGIIPVECAAKFQDYLYEKKQLALTKIEADARGSTVYTRPPQQASDGFRREAEERHRHTNTNYNFGQRQGRVQHTDESHDADVIHSRLLDLMDPARHMHPGIPYDFYSGYIIMVADNVDADSDDDEDASSSYYSATRSTQPSTTHLLGRLSQDVMEELQRNYGRYKKISADKVMLKMSPVEVLNLLGNHGFRVIGFTAEADKKMVWTLEQRNFENLTEGRNIL